MKKNDLDIQKSFDSTLRLSDLADLATDYSELSIDQLLQDGIIKDIPIIRTLASIISIGANVNDRLFLKKILAFISELNDIDSEDRKRMIDEIDGSAKYRVKVGEKLLYIIDSCNDFQYSELIAKMFKAYIQGRISYDEFIASSDILKDINLAELKWFLEVKNDGYAVEDAKGLIGSGLFQVEFEDVHVSVYDEDDHDILREGGNRYKSEVEGGHLWVYLTVAGRCIQEILADDLK